MRKLLFLVCLLCSSVSAEIIYESVNKGVPDFSDVAEPNDVSHLQIDTSTPMGQSSSVEAQTVSDAALNQKLAQNDAKLTALQAQVNDAQAQLQSAQQNLQTAIDEQNNGMNELNGDVYIDDILVRRLQEYVAIAQENLDTVQENYNQYRANLGS